uniref:GRAM domain containing 1B n=1 Tax=Sarcophilus harrisii TaxID=9305 RepID=A0A7N4P3N5_SARHA
MPAANIMENLQLPALQVPGESQGAPEVSPVWSSSSTPTLRRRRFKMRRMKNVQEQSLEGGLAPDLSSSLSPGKEFLQLPSIEITPSSDEDTPWSNCSTPSASPRRKRFLLRKWLRVRERKQCSESSHQIFTKHLACALGTGEANTKMKTAPAFKENLLSVRDTSCL